MPDSQRGMSRENIEELANYVAQSIRADQSLRDAAAAERDAKLSGRLDVMMEKISHVEDGVKEVKTDTKKIHAHEETLGVLKDRVDRHEKWIISGVLSIIIGIIVTAGGLLLAYFLTKGAVHP